MIEQPLSSPSNSSSLSPSSLPSLSSQASSSRQNTLSNTLPLDRVPPPKNKSAQSGNGNGNGKFKIGKKDKKHSRKGSVQVEAEDDWFQILDGPPASTSSRPVPPLSRHNDPSPSASELSVPLFDSQLTEVPKEKKNGRGRGLAKKTSQLFSRSKDRDKDNGGMTPTSDTTSLNLPINNRNNSHSSAASGDSNSTSASSRQRFSIRPGSSSSKTRSPRSSHSRRLSQDSATSWQPPPPRNGRSGSSSTYDSPTDIHLPIPQRQAPHLSASVPTLTRQSMPPSGSLDSNGTVPSRMSSWFSHLLPSTSSVQTPYESTSPQKKPASAAASFLNAARQRAVDGVRHLLDSEAQPDKCPDTIWVMGSPHPGYNPSSPALTDSTENLAQRQTGSSEKASPPKSEEGSLGPASWKRQPISPPAKGFGNLFSSSTLSLALPAGMTGSPVKDDRPIAVESPSKGKRSKGEVLKWPDEFYDDFKSRIWCTYRSQYAPILALPNGHLLPTPKAYYSAFGPPADLAPNSLPSAAMNPPPNRPSSSPWGWSRGEGLTSDAGWGCMLRTGQSMLANALIHLHLGRDWRLPADKPSITPYTAKEFADLEDYSTYVKILSWFLDDPSPLCPFSVHRMALIGKELGKDVGEWFGPSTAAGALKTLGNSFPLCGLAVATAADSIIYKSDVYAASRRTSDGWVDKKTGTPGKKGSWGSKAVLVLIGIRLGLDGVNPIYYDSVKALFTFPQSVGIAGGRPSSSYYFVASQANSLFYLDPHFTRPAIPLEIPPASTSSGDEEEPIIVDRSVGLSYTLDVVDVDDLSEDSDTDTTKRDTLRSSPEARRLRAPPGGATRSQGQSLKPEPPSSPSDPFIAPPTRQPLSVDPSTTWYANAYPEAALRTFHCDKVKKIPLSGLDPSMLLGFLITGQADFDDFVERVNNLPQKIFTMQDEPPSWDDDDETGLESVSEPEMDDLADDLAGTNIDAHAGDVSETTIQPVPITKQPVNDEEWEEELRSTPSQKSQNEEVIGGKGSWTGTHGRRPPPVPLERAGKEGGMATDSWVRPVKGKEAPNGASVL